MIKFGTRVKLNSAFYNNVAGIVIDVEDSGIYHEDRDTNELKYLILFEWLDHKSWCLERTIKIIEGESIV